MDDPRWHRHLLVLYLTNGTICLAEKVDQQVAMQECLTRYGRPPSNVYPVDAATFSLLADEGFPILGE